MDGGLVLANAMAPSPAVSAAVASPPGGAMGEPGQDGSFLDALTRNLAVAAAPISSAEAAGLGVVPPNPVVTPDFPAPIAAQISTTSAPIGPAPVMSTVVPPLTLARSTP